MPNRNLLTNRGLLFDEMQKKPPIVSGASIVKQVLNLKNLSYNLVKRTFPAL